MLTALARHFPWRSRLFDSLVVFQNYIVDEEARRFGSRIGIADFAGPIHTNYPVLLLAEPGAELRLTLIYDRQTIAQAAAERWANDLAMLLDRLPVSLDRRIREWSEGLSRPVAGSARTPQKIRTQSQNFVPPQTEMERTIAGVWESMFAVERVGIEDNLFDLGGHSLLVLQMHGRLRETLKTDFPVVALFEHPTVGSLARHLSRPAGTSAGQGQQWRDAAERRKEALARLRLKLNK